MTSHHLQMGQRGEGQGTAREPLRKGKGFFDKCTGDAPERDLRSSTAAAFFSFLALLMVTDMMSLPSSRLSLMVPTFPCSTAAATDAAVRAMAKGGASNEGVHGFPSGRNPP